MKNTIILLTLALVLATSAAYGRTPSTSAETPKKIEALASFKILNDNDGDVQIHTGTGFVELNKGSSTSLTCEVGKEIRSATKGKKGDIIFIVDDSMCGKTVKLSTYL